MIEQRAVTGGETPPRTGAQEMTVRRVAGTPAQVKATVQRYRAAGMVGEVGRLYRVPGRPGQVFVDLCLIEVEQASGWTPARKTLVIAAAAVAVLLALGWGLFMLASAAAAAATSVVPLLLVAAVGGILVRRMFRPRGCTTTVTVTHKH